MDSVSMAEGTKMQRCATCRYFDEHEGGRHAWCLNVANRVPAYGIYPILVERPVVATDSCNLHESLYRNMEVQP